MRIVELEHVVRGKVIHRQTVPLAEHILETGRGQEILLAQAQFLAVLGGVVGIQHHGDVLGLVLHRHRGGIVAGVETLQVESVGGLRRPQAQGVDHAVAIAADRHIVGNGVDILGVDPAHMLAAVIVDHVLGAAMELDHLRELGALHLPGVAVAQPVIRVFDLLTVLDVLVEHAVFVAQAVAEHRQAQGGAAVEKTGRQTPKTTVTQAGIRLLGFGVFKFDRKAFDRLTHRSLQIGIEHVIAQRTTDQVFQRQVMRTPHAGHFVVDPGAAPVVHQAVAHHVGQRLVEIDLVATEEAPKVMIEVAPKISSDGIGSARQSVDFLQKTQFFGFLQHDYCSSGGLRYSAR